MNQEIQQNEKAPFTGVFSGSILGVGISSVFLFLFFKIPPLFLYDYAEEMRGVFPVIMFAVVYLITTVGVLSYFHHNKYLVTLRVVYWSGLIIFYYAVFLVLFSALSWLLAIPIIIFGFPLIIIPAGIFLFRGIEKTILQTPLESAPRPDSISVSQKLKSLFMDEKPKL